VIDNATVITGSFNWTNDAEHRNAENVVVIHDAPTATAFARDFAIHWNHSQPFSMKPATGTKNDKPRANLHHH
jgi:phosphatidylserine/phosphatidylglycerophosphate/cardiolipin synthase-like enzyme